MENIFDRLQFVKGLNPNREDGIFNNREDAVNYVLEKQVVDRPTVVAEPIVLRYESDSTIKGPNVILAIGSIGKGTPTPSNRTFFIDTQKTEEEIIALDEKLEKAIKSLSIIPLESDTLVLNSEKTDNGTILSGDVKIAEYRIVDGKANYNIIQTEGDKGIYAFVDMDYDPDTFVITFNVNGVTKEFQLPKDQHVVKGWYDPKEESIFLKLADDSQVKVLVTKLIEEWTVLPDGQTINDYNISGSTVNYTPIVFSRTHVGAKATEHEGIYEWQDVLEADVRVADHITDNIIHKDRTGRYLYVKGTADNIKYKEGVTVKDALDNVDTKVSTSTGNLIYKRPDGIYAAAMLNYNQAENKLIYTYSDGNSAELKEVEFKLNSVKILEDITYDPLKEVIVIRYIDAQGEYQRVEIPAGDIIEEWIVENEAHNIYLNKYRSEGKGKDVLTADAKIHKGNNNILEDLNHELYVNGISDNIKYDVTGDTTVKTVLDDLSSTTISIDEKLSQEILDRENADNIINNTIGTGFTDDPHDNITYKFEALSGKVDSEVERLNEKDTEIEALLNSEITRSTEEDEKHDEEIKNINDKIGDGFDTRNTVRDEIDNLQSEINNISADSLSRLSDIINEDNSINVETRIDSNGKPTIKVIDVNLSEEVEDEKANIIKLNSDGLYAGVDLIYDFDEETGTNQLIFKTTNGSKVIKLDTVSGIESITYDKDRGLLVIKYYVNGGQIRTVEVPVDDLFNEWEVENPSEKSAVVLTKTDATTPDGKDKLSGKVLITDDRNNDGKPDEGSDNIIEIRNNGLYVSGAQIESNRISIEALDERLTTAENDIDSLENAIAEETIRAKAEEESLDRKITAEVERATRKENDIEANLNNEITRSTDKDAEIETNLNNEITRSTVKDQQLTDDINNEIVRATSAETALDTKIANEETRAKNEEQRIETKLDEEISRSIAKDGELQSEINSLDSDLANEILRATNSESALTNMLQSEIERAKLTENEISHALSGETNRATAQEAYLLHLIEDEAEKRVSGDSINANAISSEESRAKEAERILETSINNEISRAMNAETALDNAITAETVARQEEDNKLYVKISDETVARTEGDTALSAAVVTEVSRAMVAEEVITQNLADEITRSTTEDARLYNLITAETASRIEADDELEEAIRKATLTFDDTNTIDFTRTTGNVVTANVKLQGGENIIKAGEGLYASVALSYDGARNTIKLVTSNGEQEAIQLNTVGSLIDGIEYDADERQLIIKYHDAAGNTKETRFSVNQLFNDWEVDNPSTNSAIELSKVSPEEADDPDKLSGRILITDDRNNDGKPDDGSENIIEIKNNGLYVDGTPIKENAEAIECLNQEAKSVEKAIFGKIVENCGSGFTYTPPTGTTYISNAVTLDNATYILDNSIKNLSSYTENVENKVNIVSGNVNCLKSEVKTVENDILGMPLLHECGEGDSYIQNYGTNYIFSGTSFNNVDVILDREIKKTNDELDITNQKINVISGGVECVENALDSLAKISFGDSYIMPDCGEGAVYPVYRGCIISAATSLYEADEILNDEVCNIIDGLLFLETDTPSNHAAVSMYGRNRYFKVDTRLSHGTANGMEDEELVISTHDGVYIDPTRTEFTDTNVIRLVNIDYSVPDAPYNGLYLSNIWDCGLYYSETEDADAIAAAQAAGYNTNYYVDESSTASNYNYMNNVRQTDKLD